MDLLRNVTANDLVPAGLAWDHQPPACEALPGGGLRVHVPPQVDYFQDPAGIIHNDSAPYLWMEVSGDFVVQAHVRPTFTSHYDAGAIMVRQDAQNWAKLCFESTDLETTAAVSVVTRGTSDDANGADLTVKDVWLQVVRSGNVFGMHYAVDGKSWRMVRLFQLSLPAVVKVGLVAQCPIGPGTSIDFLSFEVEQRKVHKVHNLRAGV